MKQQRDAASGRATPAPQVGPTRRPAAGESNADLVAAMQQSATEAGGPGQLDAAFDAILQGDLGDARDWAHAVAVSARDAGDAQLAAQAGLVWQVSDAFSQAQTASKSQRFGDVMTQANIAATHTRTLQAQGAVDAGEAERAIQSAGGYWTLANEAAKKQAAAGGGGAPIVDQHRLDHWNSGAFCGIATLIMMLRGNDKTAGSSNADLERFSAQVYHPGKGTSGAQMAGVLRGAGIADSTYTTTGTKSGLVETLERGQSVPFGVLHSEGEVVKLGSGGSSRYPGRRVGDEHFHKFGASGHWVLVTRFEGRPEAPTAFYVNDPDLGGELKVTPAQLDAMGVGSGNYWMVHQ